MRHGPTTMGTGLHLTVLFMTMPCVWRVLRRVVARSCLWNILLIPSPEILDHCWAEPKKVLLPPKIPWKFDSDLSIAACRRVPCWLLGLSHCREALSAWLPKWPWNKTIIKKNPIYSVLFTGSEALVVCDLSLQPPQQNYWKPSSDTKVSNCSSIQTSVSGQAFLAEILTSKERNSETGLKRWKMAWLTRSCSCFYLAVLCQPLYFLSVS